MGRGGVLELLAVLTTKNYGKPPVTTKISWLFVVELFSFSCCRCKIYRVVLTNFTAQLVLQNLYLVVEVGGEEADGDDGNDSEGSNKGKKV